MGYTDFRAFRDPIEVTVYGDTQRRWTMPYELTSNTIVTNTTGSTLSNVLYTDPIYSNPGQIVTTYQVGVDGLPVAVSRLGENVAKKEDPLAWLKRRVNEICWVPA
jgi:hypothetical protein